MGRKKLDPLAVIAAAAKSVGMEVPNFNQLDEARREADATILYLESPEKFREAECRQCHHYFATNYACVATCSDNCRREWLRNRGIEWSPLKTQSERWAGKIPLVVQPPALALAKLVLEQEQSNSVAAP